MMKRRFYALLAGFLALSPVGCNNKVMDPVAGGTSDDTHTSISLTGRVFDEDSKPLGAVIARLRHRGITDTTKSDGRYLLQGSLSPVGARSFGNLDTLDLLRNGSIVHSLPVTAWVDTLPDIFLVHRDISGEIYPGPVSVASVFATLQTSHGDTVHLAVEWNAASRRYSGFAWSQFTGGLDTFFVQVYALDSTNHVKGTSTRLRFTSIAGDIVVPSFPMGNAMVQVDLTGPDTLVRGQTAVLHATVVDSLRLPKEIQWKIGEGPWTTGRDDTLLRVPDAFPSKVLVIHLRVSRTDGMSVEDSLTCSVEGNKAWVSITTDVSKLVEGDVFRVHLADSSRGGIGIIRRWIGAPWNVVVSGRDTTITSPDTAGPVWIRYNVLNSLGDTTTATTEINSRFAYPRGLSVTVDSALIKLQWQVRNPLSYLIWERLQPYTDSFNFAYDDDGVEWMAEASQEWGPITLSRQNASKRLRFKLGAGEMTPISGNGSHARQYDMELDTTIVVECPNLVWNFEEPIHQFYAHSARDRELPIRPLSSSATVRRGFDSVFASMAAIAEFDQNQATFEAGVNGWKDMKSVSMRIRGSEGKGWIWLDPSWEGNAISVALMPEYQELKKKGITLGWPLEIDSRGRIQSFSIDSLRWSDGVSRSSPAVADVLYRNLTFKISIDAGKTDSTRTHRLLVLDDVRFENR